MKFDVLHRVVPAMVEVRGLVTSHEFDDACPKPGGGI